MQEPRGRCSPRARGARCHLRAGRGLRLVGWISSENKPDNANKEFDAAVSGQSKIAPGSPGPRSPRLLAEKERRIKEAIQFAETALKANEQDAGLPHAGGRSSTLTDNQNDKGIGRIPPGSPAGYEKSIGGRGSGWARLAINEKERMKRRSGHLQAITQGSGA